MAFPLQGDHSHYRPLHRATLGVALSQIPVPNALPKILNLLYAVRDVDCIQQFLAKA